MILTEGYNYVLYYGKQYIIVESIQVAVPDLLSACILFERVGTRFDKAPAFTTYRVGEAAISIR